MADAIEEIPIYFLSNKLHPTKQKWPIIKKKVYAIAYALQKLNYYLDGAEFLIQNRSQTITVSD